MRVRIIGGGVGGFACALALDRITGLDDIQVFERGPEVLASEKSGHGLMVMGNGVAALRALGADAILEGSNPLSRAVFQDQRGVPIRSAVLDEVYCVGRSALVRGLRSLVPRDRVHFEAASHRVGIPRGPGLPAVDFVGGSSLSWDDVDLLVGAEGYRSPSCLALNPELKRPVSRVLEIVTSTVLPELAAQLGPSFVKTIFVGRGLAFGLLAPTADRVIGFLQFDAERYPPPARDGVQNFLLSLLDGAPEPVSSYLRHVDIDSAHLWRPVDADLPARLHDDGLILVGDAAHPVLPFSSQGASSSLEDAVLLAEDLAQATVGDLTTSLSRFAARRRAALTPYLEAGRRILESFVAPSGQFALPYVQSGGSRLEDSMRRPGQSLARLLRLVDTDASGRLDLPGLRDFLHGLAVLLDEDDLQLLWTELDGEGSGFVSTEGLLELLDGPGEVGGPEEAEMLARLRSELSDHRVALVEREVQVRRIFTLLDTDRDGLVGLQDFSTALALQGVVAGAAGARRRFAELDQNGDGFIDAEELFVGLRDVEADSTLLAMGAGAQPVLSEQLLDPFADERVDRGVLRERAFNFRWAVVEPDVIPLTAADPDFPVAEPILEALRSYLAPGYLSYGPAEGLPEFREAAASHLAGRYGIPCDAGRVLATNSAASALYLAAAFALQSPGDEALIADPVDFLFERSVLAAGGRVRRFSITEERGWSFDLDEIESKIVPGTTRLLALCNPHNPLGRVWSREELERLAGLALEHDLWIVSDEVWADIVHSPNQLVATASLGPEVAARTFSIHGFSKSYGLAGLRLGLLVSPTSAIQEQLVRLSHADSTAYGVSTLSQVAGMAAYRSAGPWLEDFLDHLKGQRDYAVRRLRKMPGLRCHSPEGTYVLFPDISQLGVDAESLTERLLERQRLAVVPGSPRFFGPAAAGHLRLSFATSRAILREGLDRLEAGLEELA